MSSPRILLAASEVPALGGSATASYDLFRLLRERGHDVHYASLLNEDDAAWCELEIGPHMGNPAGLPHVHTIRVTEPARQASPGITRLVRDLAPDVMAGFGFTASQRLKNAEPDRPVAFVTGSCRQAQDYVTSGRARDANDLQQQLARGTLTRRIVHQDEARAVALCDLVITHSRLTLDMMTTFFPGNTGKIWPGVISFAEWIAEPARAMRHQARPFQDRDIDVLCVATDWSRREKNYPLVAAVAKRLGTARVHVVGAVPHRLSGVSHHGFIGRRDELFALMGRSRCVACPSLIDAAPGIVFEASALGCNVVASRNCGNWDVCDPGLLADPLGVETLVARILLALERPPGTAPAMASPHSIEKLVEVLGALAQPIGKGRAA